MLITKEQQKNYLLIGSKRWVLPTGQKTKKWVYDGVVFCVNEGELKMSSFASRVPEEFLNSIFRTDA